MKKTMIQISVDSRNKLKEMGRMGDTYDDVIKRLYEKVYAQKMSGFLMKSGNYIDVEDLPW